MKIKTPSRIHITLIDLNGSIGRIDGGVGLALENPFIEIKAKECDGIEIVGEAENLERFKIVAEKMAKITGNGVKIEVLSDYKSHVGLGSGTQISLAVGEAFNKLYNLGLSVREIAEIVGRGGTSGIGVAAFQFGGFIVDGGHSKKEKKDFLPSSASKAKPPRVIVRHDFPDWKVILAIPDLKGFYGRREVDLFQKNCPIPIEEVRELCHLILMKLIPAVVEKDLDEFSFAIRRIQEIGFKRVEVEQYNDLIKNCFKLYECVGMSSTGPTVYAITDSDAKSIANDLKNYFKDMGFECNVVITKAKNRGAEVEV